MIWTFREALEHAGAVEALFARFDITLRSSGYLAMGGQSVDARIVAAPKQRNTEAERAMKIGLVNLAYNMRRLVWLSGRAVPA